MGKETYVHLAHEAYIISFPITALKLVEHEKGSGDEAAEGYGVVPAELVAEVEDGEDSEDGERDDFLHDLELIGREGARADAVGGDLEAVLEEGDRPADDDDLPEGDVAIFEMSVPGEGHEDVGADEKKDGPHAVLISVVAMNTSKIQIR